MSSAVALGEEGSLGAVERRLDIRGLMRAHSIPGISVAVIHNYRMVWAKGYGVTQKGGGTEVGPGTPFLAGSISKPVTALGALALVSEGKLRLDEDVNKKLINWKIPPSSFNQKEKVTLARILDHTSGITGGDFFPGYAVGDAVPTLVQILDGHAPARNDAVVVTRVPGSEWSYSGNAYLVLQQLMVDTSGKSFPKLMRRIIFEPLGMTHSTFEQPIPSDLRRLAARGPLANGNAVESGWHVQPEMAAGGLWTTPTDLAKLAIELALEYRGSSHRILPQALAREMISPRWSAGVINILGSKNDPDRMGFGFFVGKRHRFGHIGGNVGYQATVVMFADTGDGAVIMTNSDVGLQVGNQLLNEIAEVYGWHYAAPPPP